MCVRIRYSVYDICVMSYSSDVYRTITTDPYTVVGGKQTTFNNNIIRAYKQTIWSLPKLVSARGMLYNIILL